MTSFNVFKRSNSKLIHNNFLTENSLDDEVDGRFGLLCSDGGFIRKPWPKEDMCIETSTCLNFPKPSPTKLYKPLSQGFYAEGEYIHYECFDPDAILDDDSGRNHFTAKCMGDNEIGYYRLISEMPDPPPETETPSVTPDDNSTTAGNETANGASNTTLSGNETAADDLGTDDQSANATAEATPGGQNINFRKEFVLINASNFEFPKCRRRCSNYYVGRLDFKAVDETKVIRAGDFSEFSCPEGNFIDAPEPVITKIF